jgi:hypothetical protein
MPSSVCVAVEKPLPAGRYVKAGATLKVQVELAHPLVTPQQLAAKEDLPTTTQVSGFSMC